MDHTFLYLMFDENESNERESAIGPFQNVFWIFLLDRSFKRGPPLD